MRTCLQIVQDTMLRMGLGSPNTAASSTDLQVRQMLGLLNQEGQNLAARCAWEALVNEATFTTQAQEDQGTLDGDIVETADGFSYVLNDTMWDRDQDWPVFGPNPPQQWQYLKSSMVTGPYSTFRIRGRKLLFNPAPPAGHTIAFEWVSRNWVSSASAVTQSSFLKDNDFPLLDDQLLSDGLEWRWKKSKGLAYQEDFNTYERRVADAMARDGAKPTLSLSGRKSGFEPVVVAPVGSWDL